MDTIEQLDGKYFFDGMSVNSHELLLWLILDEFIKQFDGITDIVAVASMLASIPVIPVRGKLDALKATGGTSPLSMISRMYIRQRFKKPHRTITWGKMLRGQWTYTTSVGAYVGRWVPWIGAALTAYDISIITRNVIHRYRLITGIKG